MKKIIYLIFNLLLTKTQNIMQKFLRFFVLMAMFALPFASNAQTSWTVADSTAVHAMVPLDFYNCDGSGVHEAQMLYPASLLTSMNGSTLGSITFYHQNATASKTLTASTWYILIGETTETDLSSGFSTVALDTVYAGNLVVTSGVFSFDFTTPYTYNGGNLIVEILTTGATGNWFGSSNQGCYGMDNIGSTYSSMSTPNYTSFLPKTTFTEAPTCFPVINLAATSVTSTGLTLTWSDDVNSSATYTIYNMADTTVVASAISGTTYTISNLDANTLYTYGVAADCGGGDVASIATLSVRTSCATYTAPYTWDFEDMPTDAAPLCWNKVGTGSANVMSSTSNTHGGSKYLRFSGSTSNLVVLPEFSDDISDLQIRFWTRPESFTNTNCGTFSVGYVTDANDASTFVEMANFTYSDFSAYTEKTVYFTNAPMGARMAMRHNAGSTSWYWYVDDVTVEAVPNCVPVSGLTVSDITTTDATLNWIGNADGYTIYDMSDTSVYQYTTDTTVTLYALDPMTAYTFGVAANCGSDESDIVTISFNTACTAVTLPFTEDFEATSGTVACWSTDGPGSWVIATGDYSASTGSYSGSTNAKIQHSSTGNVTKLISPALDLDGANGAQLVFAHIQRAWSGDQDELRVYYRTSDTTAWNMVAEYTNEISSWTVDNVMLPATTYQVAFEMTDGYGYGVAIDSVVLNPFTGDYCAPVTALTVDSVSTTNVYLSWTSDATNFTVLDMADGSVVATSTTTTATVSGLTAGTAYTFGVVVDCGSSVSDTVTIATMTECENTCQITIAATDGYGDGWDNSTLNISQNGVIMGTINMASQGVSNTPIFDTFQVTVCSGIPVSFSWTSGSSYDDEAGFDIIDGGNNVAYSVTDASTLTSDAVFYTLNDACPSCVMPVVSVDAVTETSVTISWTGNASSYSIYNGSTYVANVTANTYTFSGLTAATAYTFGVVALCSTDDSSSMGIITISTECGTAAVNLPLNETFGTNSGTRNCWTIIDGNNDGSTWTTLFNGNDMGMMLSFSYDNTTYTDITPNDWLVTPKLHTTTGSSVTMTWDAAAADDTYYAEHYGVYVSTTNTDTNSFTLVNEWTLTSSSTESMNLDLSAYAGQDIYVAFRHFNCTGQYVLLIDNVNIYEGVYVPDTLTVTVATMDATMGTTNPAPGTYQYAETETVQLAGVPNSGYHFTGWTYTTDGTNYDTLGADYITVQFPASLFMSTGSVTFTALFEAGNPDSTTVTYAVNNATMGTTIPAPGTYTAYVGSAVQAEAVANNGYALEAWILEIAMNGTVAQSDTLYSYDSEFANPINVGTIPQSFADMGATITLTAVFGIDTTGTPDEVFTLITAVNDATMGTITPAPGTYTYVAGDSILFDFTAAEGYTIGSVDMSMSFMGMTIMDTTLPGLYAMAMAQEPLYADDFLGMTMSLTINFVADTNSSDAFTLVTAVNDATMGTMTPAPGTYTYNAGDVVNFTVTPNEGYAFESVTMSISYMGMTVQEETMYDLEFTTEPLPVTEDMLGFTMTVTVNFKSTQGIENADEVNVNAYSKEGNIVLNGAEGREVYLFDINGRMLNHTATAAETEVYSVPASGVYLIKVDGVQTKRVVVIR